MKKIIFALLIFISLISNCYADNNTIDFNKTGTMNVVIKYGENENIEYVSNVELTSYLIATINRDSYNLKYNWVNELSNINLNLNDLNNLNANDIINYINDNNINIETKYTGITDSEGKLSLNNMELGLYLVVQTNKVKGYDKIASYMLSIPYLDDNNMWTYETEAEPKPPLDKLMDINVIKVWNNNKSTNPDSITFELRKGNEDDYVVIDTIELNIDNEWSYTFEQISESNDYFVVEIDVPKGYKVSYSFDSETNTFTITNTAKLPQTGSYTYLIPIFLVIGFAFIGTGIVLERRYDYE